MNITAETMTLMKEALSQPRTDLRKAVTTSHRISPITT